MEELVAERRRYEVETVVAAEIERVETVSEEVITIELWRTERKVMTMNWGKHEPLVSTPLEGFGGYMGKTIA